MQRHQNLPFHSFQDCGREYSRVSTSSACYNSEWLPFFAYISLIWAKSVKLKFSKPLLPTDYCPHQYRWAKSVKLKFSKPLLPTDYCPHQYRWAKSVKLKFSKPLIPTDYCPHQYRWAKSVKLKFSKPLIPTDYCPHQYRSAKEMTSTFETRTHTLRYGLRSREIYIEERTPITSPETLSEPHETQDESVNTIQETPSVTPCMPRIDSEKSANCSPPPHYLAPPPVTPPRTSHLPLHLAPPQA